MRCNLCWKDVCGQGFLTRCRHLFCSGCGRAHLEQKETCPLCAQVLPKNGVRPVPVEADDAMIRSLASSTFGLEPDTLVDILRHGVQFWASQQRAAALHEASRSRELEAQLQQVQESEAKAQRALADERARTARLKTDKAQLRALVKELSHQQNSQERPLPAEEAPAHPVASASALLHSLRQPSSAGAHGKRRQQSHNQRHVGHIEPLDRSPRHDSAYFMPQMDERVVGADAGRADSLKRSRSHAPELAYETPSGRLGSTTSRRRLPNQAFHVDQVDRAEVDQEALLVRSSRAPAARASASPRRLSRFFPAPRATRSALRPASSRLVYDGEPVRAPDGDASSRQRRQVQSQAAAQSIYPGVSLDGDHILELPITRGDEAPAASDGTNAGGGAIDFAGARSHRHPVLTRK